MNQGKIVAVKDCGLWVWASYVGRKGKLFVFRVGRQQIAVNHWDVEFPRYEDDE